MTGLSNRLAAVRLAGIVTVCVLGAGVAEARPVRGPLARAERRVIRAQAAFDRELARPLGRVRLIEVPVYPVSPGAVPAVGAAAIPSPAVPAAAQAAAAAPARVARPPEPRAAAASPKTEPGVARAGFEAQLPEPVSSPREAAATEPAADGTVSVLVRPDAPPAGSPPVQERAAEPLLFPGSSQP